MFLLSWMFRSNISGDLNQGKWSNEKKFTLIRLPWIIFNCCTNLSHSVWSLITFLGIVNTFNFLFIFIHLELYMFKYKFKLQYAIRQWLMEMINHQSRYKKINFSPIIVSHHIALSFRSNMFTYSIHRVKMRIQFLKNYLIVTKVYYILQNFIQYLKIK